jgi:hypothetical protein
MSDALAVYSAREVAVSWGLVNMEGFSNDNIVTMEYNSDLTSEVVSADGKLATAVTPDRTGTITVEVMQTSKTNIILSGILAYQNNLDDTSEILKSDFAVADPSGSVLCVGRNAYLKKAPSIGLGIEQGTYEWVFVCEKLDFLSLPRGIARNTGLASEVAAIISGMSALGRR